MAGTKTNSNSMTAILVVALNNKRSSFRNEFLKLIDLKEDNLIFYDGTHTSIEYQEINGKEVDVVGRIDGKTSFLMEIKVGIYESLQASQAKHGEYAYAALYPIGDFSKFVGNKEKGSLYVFSFIYDEDKHYLNRGYYEVIWGGQQRRTYDAEAVIERVKAAEHAKATLVADSLQRAVLVDSLIQTGTFIEIIEGEEKLIK